MTTAKIKEDRKPEWDALLDEFDIEGKKGAFERTQFDDAAKKLSVPQGRFELTVDGKTYPCSMLIATHFALVEDAGSLTAGHS